MSRIILLIFIGSLVLFLLLDFLALIVLDSVARKLEQNMVVNRLQEDVQALRLELIAPDPAIDACRHSSGELKKLDGMVIDEQTNLKILQIRLAETANHAARCYKEQAWKALTSDMGWETQQNMAALSECLSIANWHIGLTPTDLEMKILEQIKRTRNSQLDRDKIIQQARRAIPVLNGLLERQSALVGSLRYQESIY